MPIHQSPVSRRQFLRCSAGIVGGLVISTRVQGAGPSDSTSFALLSDTHIPSSPDTVAHDVNMTSNLRQVVREVLAWQQQPAGVIVTGDCAYLKGLPEDYANFASTIQPVTASGLPLHLMTGNHDHRGAMVEALTVQSARNPLVQSRFVSILETPQANLFLLDSLTQTNVVTGELGDMQRNWLTQALQSRQDKPAVVVVHHNLQLTPPAEGKRITGLADSLAFLELLKSHRHVKAYIFGHTHNWSLKQMDGLHLINLPPVAYVFGEGRPNGWVQATFHPQGLTLTLKTIDAQHPLNGKSHEIHWS
jgi:3',5'-cyclic AMP phosphodiesterase CpdA